MNCKFNNIYSHNRKKLKIHTFNATRQILPYILYSICVGRFKKFFLSNSFFFGDKEILFGESFEEPNIWCIYLE